MSSCLSLLWGALGALLVAIYSERSLVDNAAGRTPESAGGLRRAWSP